MEISLSEIAKKYNFDFSETEGVYHLDYSIRNLPTKMSTISKVSDNFQISAQCEFLWGTSTKPSYFAGNTPDQYRYRVDCKLFDNYTIPNFYIYENDFFRKLFFRRDLSIQCRDVRFRAFLRENIQIEKIYKKCKSNPEISPTIRSRNIDKIVKINIDFHSYKKHNDALDESIKFCQNLINLKSL